MSQKTTAKSLLIEMINDKIKEYQKLIADLEDQKKMFLSESNPKTTKLKRRKLKIKTKRVSTFKRLMAVLDDLPEIFTRIEIKEYAERDGLGEILDGTFSPAFSETVNRGYVVMVEEGMSGKPAKYKKTPKGGDAA